MDDHAVNTIPLQSVISGESAKSRFIDSFVDTIRIMFSSNVQRALWQKTFENVFFIARLGNNSHAPSLQMHINSDVEVLPIEIYSFTLYHRCNSFDYSLFVDCQFYKFSKSIITPILFTPNLWSGSAQWQGAGPPVPTSDDLRRLQT